MSFLNKNNKNITLAFKAALTLWITSLFSVVVFASTVEAPVNNNVTSKAIILEGTTELLDSPIVVPNLEYKAFYDIELSNNYLSEVSEAINKLNEACISGDYTDEAILEMNKTVENLIKV